MKKTMSLLLSVCMIVNMAIPSFAQSLLPGEPAENTVEVVMTEETPPIVIGESEDHAADDEPTPPEDTTEGTTGKDDTVNSDFTEEDTSFCTEIRLTIKDINGTPLPNIQYGLYLLEDESIVCTMESDETGVASSGDIPINKDYYLEETKVPEGILLNKGRFEIKLKDICPPARINVGVRYTPIMGQIKVIKTDEDGLPLSDVKFEVYRASDTDYEFVLDDIVTGEDGIAITKMLPYGDYILSEYETQEGFAAGDEFPVSITNHGEIVELKVVNYYVPTKITITKKGEDGKYIKGAVFGIYKSDTDELVQELTTDSTGKATSKTFRAGYYYIIEKSVPAPYQVDTTPYYDYFSGEDNSFTFINSLQGQKAKLKIIKQDEDGNPIEGVGFNLHRKWDKKFIEELTTDENGIAESSELAPGEYYLREWRYPAYYEGLKENIPFVIDGSGITIEKIVVNKKKPISGKLNILKQDENKNALAGVVFGIYQNDGTLVEKLTTGKDGKAVSGTLPQGTYYFEELTGLEGYHLETKRLPFTVDKIEQSLEFTVVNSLITGDVKIVKTGKDNFPLSGVVFGIYNQKGDEVEKVTTGEDGTVVSKMLPYGDYSIKELSTQDGYELLKTEIPFSITKWKERIEIPIHNSPIIGGIKIQKVSKDKDESGATIPLSGAVFGIYDKQGKKLCEIVSDVMGTAAYYGLPKGDYYLKELIAPEGYVLPDEMFPFSIETQAQVVEMTLSNTKGFGTLKIEKSGENDAVLENVHFDVYRSSTGDKVGELITDNTGCAAINLPLGKYYLIETKTLPGYTLLNGQISFHLTKDGETITLPIKNYKESLSGGTIHLIKKDADTGNTLFGATFGIYRVADNEMVGEFTSGLNGTAQSMPIPSGYYYLSELRAPHGYQLHTEKIFVTVTEGKTTEIIVENQRLPDETGFIKVIKTDITTGEKLAGAVFGIYQIATNNKVAEIKTGNDGSAQSPALPVGDYYLMELKAPIGYAAMDSKNKVIVSTGKTVELILSNQRLPNKTGTITLTKTAQETGDKLAGATFGIYQQSDNAKVGEMTTTSDGIARSPALPFGEYYLIELRAPDGYLLDSERYPVSIDTTKTIEITRANQRKPEDTGTIKLTKTDKANGDKLAGATFGIYQQSDNAKVGEMTTASDGIARSPALPFGEYYLIELRAPDGYLLDSEKYPVSIDANKAIEITRTNERQPIQTGTAAILKIDSHDKKPLLGAVFSVYESSTMAKVGELLSDQDGTGRIELPSGNYTIKETKSPDGYRLSKEIISFSLKPGEFRTFTVENSKEPTPKTGILRIIKTDSTSGQKLAHARFGVYRSDDGTKVGELSTDFFGAAELELPQGDYYLKEISAPAGYRLKSEKIAFHIDSSQTLELIVRNFKEDTVVETGVLHILKVDASTKEPLQNAVFGVYGKDDKLIDRITTDENGIAELELETGSYYLQELESPNGYLLSKDKINFHIITNETERLTLKNTKERKEKTRETGTLKIVKLDADTGRPLSDVVFAVYKNGFSLKQNKLTTNREGIVETQLPPGDYTLKEICALEGYIKDTSSIPFTVAADRKTIVEVTNRKKEVQPVQAENPPSIYIPKTGEPFPVLLYLFSAICLTVASLCGLSLYRKRHK